MRLTDPHGLHARPAAAVARAAAGHDAEVWLTDLGSGRGPVAARSLSAVATLGAGHRALVRVEATGPDAAAAVGEVAAVLTGGATVAETATTSSSGRPAAAGSGLDVALGPAVVVRAGVSLDGYDAGPVETELDRSSSAAVTTSEALAAIGRAGDADTGAVLAAQRLLLEDPSVLDDVVADIRGGTPAPHAWRQRLDAVAAGLEQLPDPYQRERATDVRSVRDRLLRALTGTEEPAAGPGPGVLVVHELDAATAATVDATRTAGIVDVTGGPTGHGAIVARARGIPLLTGAGSAADGLRDGQVVAFDARSGELWVDPDDATRRDVEQRIGRRTTERAAVLERAAEPAVTRGGRRVPVLANVASLAEAEAAAAWADGSGLVRTELLFGGPGRPGVDEQERVLREVVAAFGERPVTVRSWDVGADKPLPFFPRVAEENPALGARGIRMIGTTAEPLLVEQLRAVCRVAASHPLRLMFPMVTTRGEVDDALRLLEDAAAAETGAVPPGLEVGIMIEVPAAALSVAEVARGLDFVSIGTNDLTQYVTAADRGNPAVGHLAAGVSPAVLRLIGQVVDERPDGVEVSVCGDLASRPAVVHDLLRLGVDELSCAPAVVPEVKAAVRACD
ncbi:HPr family phosphocarrier protein [Nocardioides marinquilinus]|uniref:HPr family phosphocarrier protein n=1 Tax=Nocardioides marinquilinus TaxID=1210400 RepID=UPI0031E52CBA